MKSSTAEPVQVEVIVQDCTMPLGNDPLERSHFEPALASTATAPQGNVAAEIGSVCIGVLPEQWEDWLQQWLNALQADLPTANGYEICIRLTSDDEIQQLNNQFRHKDQPTDVLSFAALEAPSPMIDDPDEESFLYLGDIVISIDTARRQAQERDHSPVVELAWLTSHGLLHLLGWDHPDEESLDRMLQQQKQLLETVGLQIAYD